MTAIAPGTKFKVGETEYKVIRPNRQGGWTCLYYQKNSGLTKVFSEQEILEVLA
jgi:hypothetical protein